MVEPKDKGKEAKKALEDSGKKIIKKKTMYLRLGFRQNPQKDQLVKKSANKGKDKDHCCSDGDKKGCCCGDE